MAIDSGVDYVYDPNQSHNQSLTDHRNTTFLVYVGNSFMNFRGATREGISVTSQRLKHHGFHRLKHYVNFLNIMNQGHP